MERKEGRSWEAAAHPHTEQAGTKGQSVVVVIPVQATTPFVHVPRTYIITSIHWIPDTIIPQTPHSNVK